MLLRTVRSRRGGFLVLGRKGKQNLVREMRTGEGRFQNGKERERLLGLIGNLAGVLQHMRVGELGCDQPGGREVEERG
jgi:hypothetical protein